MDQLMTLAAATAPAAVLIGTIGKPTPWSADEDAELRRVSLPLRHLGTKQPYCVGWG